MARTKAIMTNNSKGNVSVEILITSLTVTQLQAAIKLLESQLKEGGTNACI